MKTERSYYANVKQILSKLLGKEYTVEIEYSLGQHTADLVVLKHSNLVAIIEVKTSPRKIKQNQLEAYQKHAPTFVVIANDKEIVFYDGGKRHMNELALKIKGINGLPDLNLLAENRATFAKEIYETLKQHPQYDKVLLDLLDQLRTYNIELSDNREAALKEIAQLLALKPLIHGFDKTKVMDKLLDDLYMKLIHMVEWLDPVLYNKIQKDFETFTQTIDPNTFQTHLGDSTITGDLFAAFYQEFLSKFDPELRKNFGIYYTPYELVEQIIKFVDTLMLEYFDTTTKDCNVTILDPAFGVGTFLKYFIDKYGTSRPNTSRLYGFEINPVSYVIARQILMDKANLYLTNTLKDITPLDAYQKRLFDEIKVVRYSKEIKLFIGNPPYKADNGNFDSDFYEEVNSIKTSSAKANLLHHFIIWTMHKMKQQKCESMAAYLVNPRTIYGSSFHTLWEQLKENFDIYMVMNLNKYFTVRVEIALLMLLPKKKGVVKFFDDFDLSKEIQINTTYDLSIQNPFPVKAELMVPKPLSKSLKNNLFTLHEGPLYILPFVHCTPTYGNKPAKLQKKQLDTVGWALMYHDRHIRRPYIMIHPEITYKALRFPYKEGITEEEYLKLAASTIYKIAKNGYTKVHPDEIKQPEQGAHIDAIAEVIKKYIPKLKNPPVIEVVECKDDEEPDFVINNQGFRFDDSVRNLPFAQHTSVANYVKGIMKYHKAVHYNAQDYNRILSEFDIFSGYVKVLDEMYKELDKIIKQNSPR